MGISRRTLLAAGAGDELLADAGPDVFEGGPALDQIQQRGRGRSGADPENSVTPRRHRSSVRMDES
ncbi:hypothetical protein OG562_44080 [Streptomyces sp. NBC_01275]|uniref:hypothetical protein n=1 Tax=Streptomyces sp. NBC_01275 TaxID=2903807 RepID=UPI00225BCE76|nr:hypothetical protein [Streptomyces sp. NBC_01275]MCX4767817.1 hypothetical protein [Streptomyces sp. NBC_01275]